MRLSGPQHSCRRLVPLFRCRCGRRQRDVFRALPHPMQAGWTEAWILVERGVNTKGAKIADLDLAAPGSQPIRIPLSALTPLFGCIASLIDCC